MSAIEWEETRKGHLLVPSRAPVEVSLMSMLVLPWCLETLGAGWFLRAGTKVLG